MTIARTIIDRRIRNRTYYNLMIVAISIAIVLITLVVSKPVYAAILLYQTTSSARETSCSGNCGTVESYGSFIQQLGTNLNMTITGATIQVSGDTSYPDWRARIICFGTGGYIYGSKIEACSGVSADSNNQGGAKHEITFTFSSSLTTDTSKYYALYFYPYNNSGPSDNPNTYGSLANDYADGIADYNGASKTTRLNSILDFWFKLHGTSNVPTVVTTLEATSAPPYIQNQVVVFRTTWYGINFYPGWVYVYDDVEETNYETIPIVGEATTSGSYVFNHKFTYGTQSGQQYNTMVDLSNCGPTVDYKTGSGCSVRTAYLTSPLTIYTLGGAPSLDTLFPSTITADRTLIKAGEAITYDYSVSSSICSPGSILQKRLLMGYPNDSISTNSGSYIYNLTGSTTLQYNEVIDSMYYPNIRILCTDSRVYHLYLGNTWYSGKATGVSVLSEGDYAFRTPVSWLNGGSTITSGSGTFDFESDKREYALYEPVSLKWSWTYDRTMSSIRLYYDHTQLPNQYQDFTTASDLSRDHSHFYIIGYNASGFYNPSLVFTPTIGNPFEIYLGGGATIDPIMSIYVTNTPWTGKTNLLYPSEGSGGIFGFDASLFEIPITITNNGYLKAAIVVVNPLIKGLVLAVEAAYSLLTQSKFFAWFVDTIDPPPGSVRYVPTVLFQNAPLGGNIDISSWVPADMAQYTISYADESTAWAKGVRTLMGLGFALFATEQLIEKFMTGSRVSGGKSRNKSGFSVTKFYE